MSGTLFQLSHGKTITAADNGNFGVIGDAGHGTVAGAIVFEFLPTAQFVGTLSVMGRVGGGSLSKQDNAIPVSFAQIPWRRVVLNGVVGDYALTNDTTTPITGASIIHVPACGLSVAILVTCSAGAGTFYIRTIEGCSTP